MTALHDFLTVIVSALIFGPALCGLMVAAESIAYPWGRK